MRGRPALRLLAGACLVALPALALAQPAPAPTPPAPAAAQPAAPQLSPATKAEIEQRISALKSRLGITEAQEPAWEIFAQTMRDNAAETDSLFAQRAGQAASMNAEENMRSYAQIARTYADSTERLSQAFDTLYASLTDQQRRAADTLFRQQAAAADRPALR